MKKRFFGKLVFFVVVLILIFFFFLVKNERYHHKTCADYLYNFKNSRVQEIKTEIFKNYFLLPSIKENWDTGFLKIKVKANFIGKIFEPYLQINCQNSCWRQYFERGTSGTRYLNISNLSSIFPRGNGQVEIKGRFLKWVPQKANIFFFKNTPASCAKVMVLAPHPDDAEIAAYGLYSSFNSTVVTVTAGEAGNYQYANIYDDYQQSSLMRGRLRVLDSLMVPLFGGVPPDRIVNLGYFDGTLKEMAEHPDKKVVSCYHGISEVSFFRRYNQPNSFLPRPSKTATWQNLVADLKSILVKVNPDIIITPHPYFDCHPDHRFSTIALLEALKKIKLKKCQIFFYTIHQLFSDYYPFGPLGSLISLPPNIKDSLYFRSIYSHPLSVAKQKEKIFAIEAMHALRKSPPVFLTSKRKKNLQKNLTAVFRNFLAFIIVHDSDSYYRRAVRANELFFVISFEDINLFLNSIKK